MCAVRRIAHKFSTPFIQIISPQDRDHKSDVTMKMKSAIERNKTKCKFVDVVKSTCTSWAINTFSCKITTYDVTHFANESCIKRYSNLVYAYDYRITYFCDFVELFKLAVQSQSAAVASQCGFSQQDDISQCSQHAGSHLWHRCSCGYVAIFKNLKSYRLCRNDSFQSQSRSPFSLSFCQNIFHFHDK